MLHNKRNSYKAQLDNAESIGANQTIIPVLIKSITEAKTSKNTPYFRISAICVSKNNIFVKTRPKNAKKQKNDGEVVKTVDTVDETVVVEDTTEETNQHGTVIKSGEQFMTTTYDRSAGGLEQGVFVKMAVTSDWYIDHYTFQTAKVLLDEKSGSELNRHVYDKYVVGSPLALIPTKDNFGPEDFPEGTDEKYITRSFILPLSSGTGGDMYKNVEVQLDPYDKDRLYSSKSQDPAKYIGVNCDVGGDKPMNMLKVVYTLNDEQSTHVLMSYAFMPEIWKCFGITKLDQWTSIAGRMLFNSVDCIVYGFSQHVRIMSIRANIPDDDEVEDDESTDKFMYSTGFISKMSVDMHGTAKICGIPLSFNYIEKNLGDDSINTNYDEVKDHVLNQAWKVLLTRNKKFVFNLTDFSVDQIQSFIKMYNKMVDNSGIKFYGVFDISSDEPYEIEAESDEAREAQLVAKGFKPTVIFAVNDI